jgi:hypothetical protein
MTKLSLNLSYVLILLLSSSISLNRASDESLIKVKQPKDIKIRIEDGGSRVLTQEEARSLTPDQITVAKPVDSKKMEIHPGIKIEQKQKEQLPPIQPLLFPSNILNNLPPFVQQIFNSNLLGSNNLDTAETPSSDSSLDAQQEDEQQPKRILSILVMKSMNKDQQSEKEQKEVENNQQQQQQMPIRSNFFIFRFMPKFNPDR